MRHQNGRMLTALLLTALVTATAVCGAAAPLRTVQAEEGTEQTEEEKQLQAELDAVYAIPSESNALTNWPQGPGTYGEGAAVLDMKTGGFVYGKQMDTAFYPASITKLLTALVTLQNAKMTDKVTFVDEDINFLEYGDAHIGMNPGEEISMEDAMYGMLLASANEVSHAIIRTVGKQQRAKEVASETATQTTEGEEQSEDTLDFQRGVEMMNETAQSIGCTNSHFMNSYGLHDDNHYTTAHDMCLIGQAVYQYEEFRTITATTQHTIGPTNGCAEERVFQQNHKMLYENNENYYEYCTGGKTGFTDQALSTLVTFAEKDGKQYVAVVLKTHGRNVYPDTRNLMDYAFDNFADTPVTLEELEKMQLKDLEAADIQDMVEGKNVITLPNTELDLSQVTVTMEEQDEETKEAVLHFDYGGDLLGRATAELSRQYYEKQKPTFQERVKQLTSSKDEKSGTKDKAARKKLVGIVILVLLLILFVLFVKLWLAMRRNKKRKKRRGKSKRL